MSNFNGYLIAIKGTPIPNEYIAWEGVTGDPDQRTEAKAFVNATNKLERQTYQKFRSKIEFNTREGLDDDQMQDLLRIIKSGYTDQVQQKIGQLQYWDDKTGTYKTGTFYMADPTFAYKRIDKQHNKLYYKSIRFAFIEY